MNRDPFDPISVVEAAYRVDTDPEDWLAEVSTRAAPFFSNRVDMLSIIVDTSSEPAPLFVHAEGEYDHESGHQSMFSSLDELPAGVRNIYTEGTSSLTTLRSVIDGRPREHPVYARVTPDYFEDFCGIAARDPSGYTIQVGAALDRPADVEPGDVAMWNRISAHIANGFRLNRRVAELDLDSADAVLDPSGSVEHAEGRAEKRREVRDALRSAAVHLERARTELRDTRTGRALDLWKGLVRGTYSMVDYFDSDGRRFYVARRNEPDVDEPAGLSRRERQIVAYASFGYDNARIAYETGLASSTIATYLRRAREKLGLETRAELVHFARTLSDSEKEPE